MELRDVLLVQGAYYLVTGLWPLLHYRSFEVVTGPKRERWLVVCVAALIAVIGLTLLLGARNHSAALAFLAIASAAALCAVDTIFAARGVISSVYLLDAGMELLLISAVFLSRNSYS